MTLAITAWVLSATTAHAEQTIVFFRHGEKASGGYGQLTCQGLNRALALPRVLLTRFGPPNYAYAPNPGEKITESAGTFFYVRPAETLEPTAIRAGISVNTHYGYTDISSVQRLLITPAKANTTIFVAWEHEYLVKLVQQIMNTYGGGAAVPAWISGDYDALYVVHVTYGSTITARFDREWEGLNGLATACPS